MFQRQPFSSYSPYVAQSQGFSQQMQMPQQPPQGQPLQQLQAPTPQPQQQYFIENQATSQPGYYAAAQPAPSPTIAYRSPQPYQAVAYTTTPVTVYTPYYSYSSQQSKIGTIYPSEIGSGQVILQQAPQTPQPQPQPQPPTIQPQLMQTHQGETIYGGYQVPNPEGVQLQQQYISYPVSQAPRPTPQIPQTINSTPTPSQMAGIQNQGIEPSFGQPLSLKRPVQQMPIQSQTQISTQQAPRSQQMLVQQQPSEINFEPMELSNSAKPQVFSQQGPPGWFDIIGRGNLPSLYFTTEVSYS